MRLSAKLQESVHYQRAFGNNHEQGICHNQLKEAASELDILEEKVRVLQNKLSAYRKWRVMHDCRYTAGDVADTSGVHCPPDNPCERHYWEREAAFWRELSKTSV